MAKEHPISVGWSIGEVLKAALERAAGADHSKLLCTSHTVPAILNLVCVSL